MKEYTITVRFIREKQQTGIAVIRFICFVESPKAAQERGWQMLDALGVEHDVISMSVWGMR